jgi:hypothetical protein
MADRESVEMRYLVPRLLGKKRAHIWTGSDTACRMASTGGIPTFRSKYRVCDYPGSFQVCQLCSGETQARQREAAASVKRSSPHASCRAPNVDARPRIRRRKSAPAAVSAPHRRPLTRPGCALRAAPGRRRRSPRLQRRSSGHRSAGIRRDMRRQPRGRYEGGLTGDRHNPGRRSYGTQIEDAVVLNAGTTRH